MRPEAPSESVHSGPRRRHLSTAVDEMVKPGDRAGDSRVEYGGQGKEASTTTTAKTSLTSYNRNRKFGDMGISVSVFHAISNSTYSLQVRQHLRMDLARHALGRGWPAQQSSVLTVRFC